MKIFLYQWFDEDDYGPMNGIYIVVQAENQELGEVIANKYILRMYNTTVEDLKQKHEKYKVSEITDAEVIASGYIGLFG